MSRGSRGLTGRTHFGIKCHERTRVRSGELYLSTRSALLLSALAALVNMYTSIIQMNSCHMHFIGLATLWCNLNGLTPGCDFLICELCCIRNILIHSIEPFSVLNLLFLVLRCSACHESGKKVYVYIYNIKNIRKIEYNFHHFWRLYAITHRLFTDDT